MELLQALGINQYAIVQFFIFVATFTVLITFVFNPFTKALEERKNRTKGGETLAEEYQQKASDLQVEYQTKARDVHAQIQSIFQSKKSEATADQERIISSAKSEANDTIEKNRQSIRKSVEAANAELKSQIAPVALMITNKLLGK